MVMARGRHAGRSDAELLQTLLEACGQCEEVPEAQVDIHTGLSGSGVAFVSVVRPPAPPGRTSAKRGLPVSSAFPHFAFLGLCSQPLGRPLGPGLSPGSALVASAPDSVPEGSKPSPCWVLCPAECWL